MTKDMANRLRGQGGKMHEGYSGRSMYGNETVAVEFESDGEFREALIEVIYEAGVEYGYADEEGYEITDEAKRLRTDSLGLGIIVY